MKNALLIYFLMTYATAGSAAKASSSKVESIQSLIRSTCHRTISSENALAMVRPLYLSCVPGTKVQVELDCSVECLKTSRHAGVGK